MEKYAESNLFAILMAFIGVLYAIYLAYWPWFRPKEWRKRTHRFRHKAQKDWSFLPENVVYRFLNKHSDLDLWYARIGYLIMIILFVAVILVLYWNMTVPV